MMENFEASIISHPIIKLGDYRLIHIKNTATPLTSKMVMALLFRLISALYAVNVKYRYYAIFLQDLQIAIDSALTDAGDVLSDLIIYLVSRRMGPGVLQHFEDGFSLFRISSHNQYRFLILIIIRLKDLFVNIIRGNKRFILMSHNKLFYASMPMRISTLPKDELRVYLIDAIFSKPGVT
jgi:hypothetical protein